MIKRFNEFNKNQSIESERLAMERELIARKIARNFDEGNLENDISVADIVELITFEITHNGNFHISVSNEDSLYMQYESENIGRLKVFKPEDIATIGVIDLNGILYEKDIDLIRKLYLILKNHLKSNM